MRALVMSSTCYGAYRNCRTIIIITIIIVDIFRGADYRGQTAQWGSRQWLIRPVAFATQQYC